MPKIEVFFDIDGYLWKYKTPFPVVEFDIVEDGEKYCRGIIFELDSIYKEENDG